MKKGREPSDLQSQRRPLFLVLLCFMAALFLSPLDAEARRVKVGVFPAAPLVFVKDGKPVGLFIDLIEHFAGTLDWRIDYMEDSWSNLLVRLEKGDIDLLPAVGYTNARTVVFDFNQNPVYVDSGVVFTNPHFSLNTVFDLKGKRVAAVGGSIFTTAFISYISSFGVYCEMVQTVDNRAVMQAISDGIVDAGVTIYSLGNELAKEFPVTITAINFSPVALEFAVPKGKNADLLDGINRLLRPMINNPDSFYSRSFNKWTMPPVKESIPLWFWTGTFGLLAFGLFLSFWAFLLKRQVAAKTLYLEQEIREHELAEEKIKKNLLEKEVLLRELYHRTKNTLQVIRSMIMLNAAEYPENEGIAVLSKNVELRIQAISLVHEMLYSSQDLSKISIKTYIEQLTALILNSFGVARGRLDLKLDVEDRHFLLDTAIPFGLLLNELLTNSLKFAFPANRKGTISIRLSQKDEATSILLYSDDGIGVPGDFDFRNQKTLGLQMIFGIAEKQLNGKVDFSVGEGLGCRIELSNSIYNERV